LISPTNAIFQSFRYRASLAMRRMLHRIALCERANYYLKGHNST